MKQSSQEATSRPLPSTIRTSVGAEVPDDERGRVHLCHGYDLYNDLLTGYSWSELTYLHIRGELPTGSEADKFDFLLRCVITPGPKDWATQAAMTAAVTHTPVGNSLLAGLAVLQGRFHGGLGVEKTMEIMGVLVRGQNNPDECPLAEIRKRYPDLPGFAPPDQVNPERLQKMVADISAIPLPQDHLQAALRFAAQHELTLTKQGLFAASLLDLGFTPRQGHGLYLIAAAPGILAHLLEQMEGNWATYPFGAPLTYVGSEERTLFDSQRCYPRRNE